MNDALDIDSAHSHERPREIDEPALFGSSWNQVRAADGVTTLQRRTGLGSGAAVRARVESLARSKHMQVCAPFLLLFFLFFFFFLFWP